MDPRKNYGKAFVFDQGALDDEITKKIDASNTALNPTSKENTDFMTAANNPIVKSFESTRGKGLAGFITAMTLDYAESTWETDHGSKAPKSINVSITFSPVHDLPLGMDAHGKLIAPSHPVGAYVGSDPYHELNHIPTELRDVEVSVSSKKAYEEAIASRAHGGGKGR